jgi:alternate signal-mediated exported protein
MNKKTKGLLVAGIGASLLLGSAGTFALWFDQAGLDGDGVQTGILDLETVQLSDWIYLASYSGRHVYYDTAEVIVPGDTAIAFIDPSFITLTGDTIRAELSISGLSDALSNVVLDDNDEVSDTLWSPLDITLNVGDFEPIVLTRELVESGNLTTSVVLTPAQVAWFNAQNGDVAGEDSVSITIVFPKFMDRADAGAAGRANYWGQIGQDITIDLASNVTLDFVQTNAPATFGE